MKSLERTEHERNIESDRQSFIEAASAISIEEIPTAFDETAIHTLADNIEGNRIFILGETHGARENVDVIYTLFKKFGFRRLALEWKPELKHVAEKFLKSGELDFEAIQNSPDGRITADHFALLKKLNSEGMLDELVCFDEDSGYEGWNARDAAMTKNILDNFSHTSTLVVAGNLHAKTESIFFDNEQEEQHPMGQNVKRVIPDLASGKIEYNRGQYYNFGIREFNEFSEKEALFEARFYRNEKGLYIFEVPEAHAATVPNPHERI